MTDSPTLDERVEVMMDAIERKDRELGGRPVTYTSTREAFVQAALTALESAGYVVSRG